jgi:hypothetical protein
VGTGGGGRRAGGRLNALGPRRRGERQQDRDTRHGHDGGDGDAAPETAALLRCGYGAEQVVAFDRDDAGTIITLGQVTATTRTTRAILDVAPRAKGGLTATVADTRAAEDQRTQ